MVELRFGLRVRIGSWPVVVSPGPQYAVVKAAIRLLAAEGGSYLDARMRLEREMANADLEMER